MYLCPKKIFKYQKCKVKTELLRGRREIIRAPASKKRCHKLYLFTSLRHSKHKLCHCSAIL